MIKRGGSAVLLFIFAISIFSFSFVTGQETPQATTSDTTSSASEAQTTTSAIPAIAEAQTTTSAIPAIAEAQTPNAQIQTAVETNTAEQTAETRDNSEDEEFKDAKLEESAGITPDSPFYFMDNFFDRFRNDVSVREERIAEVREMIEGGKVEDAKKALARYRDVADVLEKEIEPERQKEARRSSAAIKNALNEIKGEIPEEQRKEFVDETIKREDKIAAAAKVAEQIKELCVQLSKLDPEQYSRMCRTDENAPKWQRELDEKLTDEQKKEAEEFFGIMSNCFRNPKGCECDKISVPSFSAMCKVKAPLAAKCEEGDIEACKDMEEGEDMADLLPPHLQSVFEKIEGRYNEAHDERAFEKYMPEECQEAGAKTPKECRSVMFKLNAPEECVSAGLTGASGDEKKCEEIMFKANAPEECIEAGVKNPKECGKIMFKQHAPEECIAAGLTGEGRGDERKCREIMEKLGGERREEGPEGYGSSGASCMQISDPAEKLKCFENAYNGMPSGELQGGDRRQQQRQGAGYPKECQEAGALSPEACREAMSKKFEERFRETKESEKRCADECSAKGGAWDFSGGVCKCYGGGERKEGEQQNIGEYGYYGYREREGKKGEPYMSPGQQPTDSQGRPYMPYQEGQYPGGQNEQYKQGEYQMPPDGQYKPEDYMKQEDYRMPEGQMPQQNYQQAQQPAQGQGAQYSPGEAPYPAPTTGTENPPQQSSLPPSEPAPAPSSEPASAPSSSPTGGVISGRAIYESRETASNGEKFWGFWFG
ncbi:MAG: hypothetical protein AABX65_04435 [Nanoarchaeota archaeon]